VCSARAAFLQQPHLEPKRHCRGREGNAEHGVAGLRNCPVQRRAHIVDLWCASAQPLCRKAGVPFRLGLLGQIAKIRRMAPGDQVMLTALHQVLASISARRIEQPIMRLVAAQVG
jgi:hypothetical protein